MRIAAVESRESSAGQWIWALAFFVVFFGALLLSLFGRNAHWIPAVITGILTAFAFAWVISLFRKAINAGRYGDGWLELETPVVPGRPLQATVHFGKGAGGPARLLVTLECWTCDWRGVKLEKLHFVRTVANVKRVGNAAEASIELDIPADAPESHTPPMLRADPDRSFAGVPIRRSDRFTIWELSVSAGTLEHVGIGRRFFVPVGEADASPRKHLTAGADAPSGPKRRPAALPLVSLVLANLVPLAGVLYFDWRIRDVVMLYWMENIIIGAYNVLRLMTVNAERVDAPDPFQDLRDAYGGSRRVLHPRLGLALFFTIHYGMFCAFHGIFLLIFLFDKPSFGFVPPVAETLGALLREPTIVVALVALVASHGISFLRHHIAGGERDRVDPGALMMRPYGRIVVTHVAVLAGAVVIAQMKEPLTFLLLLIVLKTVLDIGSHRWEHGSGSRSRGGG